MIRSLVSTIFLAVLLVGCGNGTGPESGARVTIGFGVGSSGAQTSAVQGAPSRVSVGPGFTIAGDNGVLTLTEVWMIVTEFELDKASGSCSLDPAMHCHDFEAEPAFLRLPLDGDVAEVASSDVPEGSYDEVEFEVEDLLDDDEDDDDEAAQIQAVRDQIADAVAAGNTNVEGWPDEASMLVVGAFEADGVITHFRVFFDAEIEIEIEFDDILDIGPEDIPIMFKVDVLLDDWFRQGGDVLDLTAFDWDDTMELLEFEFEFEDDHHGFELEIEIS